MSYKSILDQVLNRLASSSDPQWIVTGLRMMDWAIPQSADGFAMTVEYAHAPEPFTRYFAARRLGRFAHSEFSNKAWRTLEALAADAERLVREGASWGMAVGLLEDASALSRLCALLTNSNTPYLARRAVLMSTVPIIREHKERLDAALELINAAGADLRLQGTVAFIVSRELFKLYPAQTSTLLERWATADDLAYQRLAARIETNLYAAQETSECLDEHES